MIFTLDHPAARLPGVAGGKGASLAKMRAAGLPVPQGFVVITEAFRLSGFALPDHLNQRLASADPLDLEALESLCSAARQAVSNLAVAGEVGSAVATAYEELGTDIAVSVRSSATVEDQPWASFAGQFDTFLNVVGYKSLLDRLLQVWASLYSTHAVAYMLRLGILHDSVRMAVVIQQQLQPQASGVLFTRDPVTGDGDKFLVNAAFGLGEGVVTGQVPSDSFTLDRKTLEIVSQTLSKKNAMVTPMPEGGIDRVEVPPEQQEVSALTDQQLVELGRLAHRVTQLFDGHQDIEFAVQSDAVHLLQARPVTGIEEAPPFPVFWEDPADADYTWARGPAVPGQGTVFRLQEDAIRAYSEGSRVCFQETGSSGALLHIVCFFNGYSYARSPAVDEDEVSRRQERYQALEQAYREQGTSLYEAEIRPVVEQALAELARFLPKKASLSALAQHLEHAFQVYGHVMGNLHWRMAAGHRADWPSAYREITGESEVASGTLLQAIPNKTTQLVRWLRNLARLVQKDPDLSTIFRERSYHRLSEVPLRDRHAVRRFRARFRNLLRSYGLRNGSGFGSGVTFTTPTWNINPSQPLDLITAYAQQDLDALEQLEVEARRSRLRAKHRVRRLLANDRERLQRFDSELAMAMTTVKRMENHNHIMEQGAGGAMRDAIYWTGMGLVREGLLDHPFDVLHLSLAELKEIAKGQGPADLKALIKRRAEEFEERSRLRPPPTLGRSGPVPFAPNPLPMSDLPPNVGLDGLLLRGVGASPGKTTGLARVASVSPVPPKVNRGDILVAPNAGPAWTPIFPLLGGLVLDAGAVFQHAALVAREYGIPAVIMTRDATSVILDGQTIRVDADQGIVELMP